MRFLTAGESHGKALVGILEGMPSGLTLGREYIQKELSRRKLGFGRGDRQKIETDSVDILSGVRNGLTLGSPIALMIENKDWPNWQNTMSVEKIENKIEDREVLVPRPGHADFVGAKKYQFEDMRNVLERASARETAIRVAIGAVCKKFLEELNIRILSRVISIGEVVDTSSTPEFSEINFQKIDSSLVRCFNKDAEEKMISLIQKTQEEGDTLGGIFETSIYNLPVGLGSYVQWDRRIEGDLAKAIMSLNAIKGVEVGLGFQSAIKKGSDVHDEIYIRDGEIQYDTNRSGGITGGMTTGQPLVIKASMKPLSTLKKSLNSVNTKTLESEKAHFERSDVCAVPSAAVISESLCAIVLTQNILEMFGGDSMEVIKTRVHDWRKQT